MACSSCFSGSIHDGESPKGITTEFHGLNTYVSEPASGKPAKAIIVIIPDAFGWDFVNNRILADHYAAKGDYKVYLPDFMLGHSAPLYVLEYFQMANKAATFISKMWYTGNAMVGFMTFLYHNRVGKSFPIVKEFFRQLQEDQESALPVGCAGFCWGGKHLLLLSHREHFDDNGEPLIDAGFTGHPSMLVIPEDIEKSEVPISFAVGDKDNQISLDAAQVIKECVEAKPDTIKGEMNIYEKAAHGFCVRADTHYEDVAKQALEAEEQCISWFDTRLDVRSSKIPKVNSLG